MREERLQKIMAAAGVASRRASEQMIVEGRVKVNGQAVTELGSKVDAEHDQITVDGKPVHLPKRHLYLKLHKPRGVLSDIGGEPGERQTVADLLPTDLRRVFPVGRLDVHSEGLVLLTDDGELAHKLTHPRFQHPKTYYVLVSQRPTQEALTHFRSGVDLPEGRTAPAEVKVVERLPPELRLSKGPAEGVWLEVVLREGKKRQIRQMTAAVGYPTLRLLRWAIGPLTLSKLRLGNHEHLTRSEVTALRQMVAETSQRPTDEADDNKVQKPVRRRPGAERPANRQGPPNRRPRK
ncbi:MAG: rRNA pseudouridine synthase [Chloroflexota bacterium]|nr:rRNA pseudouridine synthase [Chloroflexota bacterium]